MMQLPYPINAFRPTTLMIIGFTAMGWQVGTGGAATSEYYRQRGEKGYTFAQYEPSAAAAVEAPADTRTPAEHLAHIRAVLNPPIADLAGALGVSRQAVYDWQNGKPVGSGNSNRLADFARAADVFAAEGLTASVQLLRRAVSSGKTIFDIAQEGGSAEDAARKLVDRVRRELQQRELLAARLAGRNRIVGGEYGAPMLDETD